MFVSIGVKCPTTSPNMKGTLWLCETCGSFLSIHSSRVVHELACPLCGEEMLESFVAFDSGLGPVFGDA